MLSPARRRRLGAFYTPSDVADRLVALVLPPGAPRVCDPACGDGAFLLASARLLEARGIERRTIATDLLWGIDIDEDAVGAARAAIAEWSGVAPADHVRVGDGLDDVGWSGQFDAVVGNPPFLNQLERATARAGAHRWSALVGPYADTAFLFLLSALDLARDGGRIALIQPQSLVAARDAAGVRAQLDARAALIGMWTCDDHVFDAETRVCAPILTKGGRTSSVVARWTGRAFTAVASSEADGPPWSAALARDGIPAVALGSPRRLGEMATATAGFRAQFYGLAPYVVEAEDGDLPRLVTCGVIDPDRCRWGERPLRFAGRRWHHPRVDLDRVAPASLRSWVDDRLVPKVVLATQTRVLEAAVDRTGEWVPSTPVIAVHAPRDALDAVAAVLLAPPVSAWAASTYAGVALAADAIKLSARQVLDIPLPIDEQGWAAGADALRGGDLLGAGRRMTEAYGAGDDVFDWWARRLPDQ